MGEAVKRLGEVDVHRGRTARSLDFKAGFAHASRLLDAMGDVIMGWMLLWRAGGASSGLEKLVSGLEGAARVEKIKKNKNAAFYDGQVKTARFFIESMLPVTMGRMDAIEATSKAAVEMEEVSFGG